MFDYKDNILAVKKVNVTAPKRDLYEDVINSYIKFKTKTIYSCVEHFRQQLIKKLDITNINIKTEVREKESSYPMKELKKRGSEYYPVYITVTLDGITDKAKTCKFIEIPYMNNLGTLNVKGSDRTVVNLLRSANSLSYDDENRSLTVTLPHRILKFSLTSRGVAIVVGKLKKSIESVLNTYMYYDKVDIDLNNYFSNGHIIKDLSNKTYSLDWVNEAEAEKEFFYKVYRDDNHILEDMRAIFNNVLTIDYCLHQVLARDVMLPREGLIIPAGTYVNQELLTRFKYNLVNEVYIKSVPIIEEGYLAESVSIEVIKEGTAMTEFLAKFIPDEGYSFIQEDIKLKNPILFKKSSVITSELLNLLHSCDVTSIKCSTNKLCTKFKEYRFEQEIVGNNFHKIGDFYGDDAIPHNLSFDDYVYIKDIINYKVPKKIEHNHLEIYDITALISLTARCVSYPEIKIVYDRDVEFIRVIDMINETFEKYLNKAIDDYVTKFAVKLRVDFNNYSSSVHEFYSLSSMWYSNLWKSKLLRIVEDTNPISLMTQIRRVTYISGDRERYSNKLRSISMGQYGKVCLYETPEGKNVGLTSSLAYGCKIKNGVPLAPYYKIKNSSKGPFVDKSFIHYLSSINEFDYSIGGIESLEFIDDKYVKNTVVLAKVPSTLKIEAKTQFDYIRVKNLDFVTVYPEQSMSVTAQLIPFASSDSAVRVSFALSRIRQALNLVGGEIPRVMTNMYKDMFDGNTDFMIRAMMSGEVIDILFNRIYVRYDGMDTEVMIEVPELRITENSVVALNYRCSIGDKFKQGDILVDSSLARNGIFSPGINVLTGIMITEGYNYEDAILMSEQVRDKFVSITSDTIVHKLNPSDSPIYDFNLGAKYRYVEDGGTIASIKQKDSTDVRIKQNIEIKSHNNSGIVHHISKSLGDGNEHSIIAKTIVFSRGKPGDKYAGRHSNKSTDSIIVPTGDMPRLLNGIPLDITTNPAGINSRLNIGQVMEGTAGFISYLLDISIETNAFNGATTDDLKKLMNFVWLIANESAESACKRHSDLPKGLLERAVEREDFIQEFRGCFDEDCQADMYNPITGKLYENKIAIGVIYLLKLEQEVDDKIHVRSFGIEESYSFLSKQPPKGAAQGGGQRVGEMELEAILAQGASANAYEITNGKSDNLQEKYKLILDTLKLDEEQEELRDDILEALSPNGISNPHSVTQFRFYLEALGIILDGDELIDLSSKSLSSYSEPDIPALMQAVKNKENYTSNKTILKRLKNYKI